MDGWMDFFRQKVPCVCRGRPSLGTQSGGGHLPGIWDILLGLCPLTGRSLSAEGRPLAWLGPSYLCVGAAFLRTLPVSTLGAPGLPGRKRLAPGPGGSLEFGACALKCQAYVFWYLELSYCLLQSLGKSRVPASACPAGTDMKCIPSASLTSPTCSFLGGSLQKWRHISPPGIGEPGIVPNSFTGER